MNMTTDTTTGTAVLRGLYAFVAAALTAGITAYLGIATVVEVPLEAVGVSERDRIVYAVLTGVLAGLGALGWRAGAEGIVDARRQATNDVRPADVSAGGNV